MNVQQFAIDLLELFGDQAGDWLMGENKLLGERSPLRAMADGDYERVEQIVGQMADGAYM